MTTSGKPQRTLRNLTVILGDAREWAGAFALDAFAQRVRLRQATPAGAEGELTDVAISKVRVWLDETFGVDWSAETILQAIELVANENQFHPVRDYLQVLVWDGRRRLETWLARYLGAADTALHSAIGARWLVSAVARVMRPGCKADHVLILEGPQGLGKSTALSILGGPYFCDQIADIGTKDALQQLHGAWIIELSELDALSRAEASAQKAFLTHTRDRFRLPYGKLPVEFPRQCVFAGSVNHSAYLRDETGNRRFWPVAVGRIDLEALRRDRDQLWAEARVWFERDERWWLSAEEETSARAAQDERFVGDEWEGHVARYLDGKDECTVAEVMTKALQLELSRLGQREQARVGKIMRRLDWERRQRRVHGRREWYYARPPSCPGTEAPGQTGDGSRGGNTLGCELSPVSPVPSLEREPEGRESRPEGAPTGRADGDAVEERAAILEFDAHIPRVEADARANAEEQPGAPASHGPWPAQEGELS